MRIAPCRWFGDARHRNLSPDRLSFNWFYATKNGEFNSESMSYLRLLKIHERLNEEFLFHQEALLDRDLIAARERLEVFEQDLRSHMQYEEEVLLPLYSQVA